MPVWLEVALGMIIGLSLIGGVFWFTFARVPERRSDGGTTNRDADYLVQNLDPTTPGNMSNNGNDYSS
jgi:hypothetical protein